MSGLHSLVTAAPSVIDRPQLVTTPNSPKRRKHQRFTVAERRAILALFDAGRSQQEIAESIGCTQPAVSKVLAELEDSRKLARKRLQAGAYAVSDRLVKTAKGKEAIHLLEDLRVLTPAQPGPSGNQVNVLVLGGGSVPADLPVTQALSPISEALTVTAIPVSAAQREAKGAEKLKD